jgi:hypothetical protein
VWIGVEDGWMDGWMMRKMRKRGRAKWLVIWGRERKRHV